MVTSVYTVGDDGTVELNVHAQPGAGRTQITGRHGDAVKIRVAVPPEHGRANAALAATLAEAFGLRPGRSSSSAARRVAPSDSASWWPTSTSSLTASTGSWLRAARGRDRPTGASGAHPEVESGEVALYNPAPFGARRGNHAENNRARSAIQGEGSARVGVQDHETRGRDEGRGRPGEEERRQETSGQEGAREESTCEEGAGQEGRGQEDPAVKKAAPARRRRASRPLLRPRRRPSRPLNAAAQPTKRPWPRRRPRP